MRAQGTSNSHQSGGATVIDERNPSDANLLKALRADPEIHVTDLYDPQRTALSQLIPPPDEELLGEPTRWVYYPWRRAVLRIVGPRSFRHIRLDRNRNKITQQEQNHFASLKVGVMGLSVGHVIAHTLALEGLCGELRLADFDEIELPNLNRIPGTLFDLGCNKAVAAARRISEIDPYLTLTVIEEGFTDDTMEEFLEGLDIVIEECDSMSAKVKVRIAARKRGIPVIMETNDRGLLDIERFDLEPDRPIFHGLLGDIQPGDVEELTAAETVAQFAKLADITQISPRLRESVPVIGTAITGIPQLGSDTLLGGVTVAAAVRRIGMGEPLPSGRIRMDVWGLLDKTLDPASQVNGHAAAR